MSIITATNILTWSQLYQFHQIVYLFVRIIVVDTISAKFTHDYFVRFLQEHWLTDSQSKLFSELNANCCYASLSVFDDAEVLAAGCKEEAQFCGIRVL
jgi:hypothetical protein